MQANPQALPVSPVMEGSDMPEPEPFTLQWSELEAYLQDHPGARLVDVREAVEHHAGGGVTHGPWTAINAPASLMMSGSPQWSEACLGPAVLVCRSGNRSLRLARWLQSQGYTAVRHVHGGLALRP